MTVIILYALKLSTDINQFSPGYPFYSLRLKIVQMAFHSMKDSYTLGGCIPYHSKNLVSFVFGIPYSK